MKLAALPVDGVTLDDWTVAPLFVLEGASVRPRPPGLVAADGLADADIAAFPALWSAYSGRAREQVDQWLDRASEAGKSVIVWVDGDQEIDLDHPAALLFEQGPERSRRRRTRVQVWPVLIHDHLAALYGGDPDPRPKGSRPKVGFCGQAAAGAAGHARLLAGKLRDRSRNTLGRTGRLASPWASHLRLRQRALATLEADDRVQTDFVVRDRYRAGVRAMTDRADRTHPTASAFFANIRASDYTVCVRGGGNFSTRLYETLCLGRIPVVVDTDIVLPWAGVVPWDKLMVIHPASELDRLADRVVAHHEALDAEAFVAAQLACRRLWEDRLSVDGFFGHFEELL